ncbi:MAG: hypothetical protein RIF41_22695 [Polyangiaceae bacterium]
MVDAKTFVPTIEAARAAGLLDDLPEPYARHAMCGLVVWARMGGDMKEIYVPRAMRSMGAFHGFESQFEGAVTMTRWHLPACLRVDDLRPRQVGGGYRAARVHKEPDFLGHRYGDTIAQAEEDLQQFFLGEQRRAEARDWAIPSAKVAAWAWPLLWLRFLDTDGECEVALYVKHNEEVAAFLGREPRR